MSETEVISRSLASKIVSAYELRDVTEHDLAVGEMVHALREALGDRSASREAILFEIAAVATRYEQDTPPDDDEQREMDIAAMWGIPPEVVAHHASGRSRTRRSLLELAGRCVAWLENLDTQAKP